MSRTFVVAEAGSCHDGDRSKACRLVHAAKISGADACKFQFWSSADRLADRRRVPDRYREIYRRYQMPATWLAELKHACDEMGLEFIATCYLPEDLDVVAPFVRRFKIASFEASDRAFVEAHRGRPTIISWGMADGEPPYFWPGAKVLHCVSAYPAPVEAMNLNVLQGDWGEPYDPAPSPFVGLSDHSRQLDMGALAVAAGAEIIETHIRLDDTDPENPDYATAFTPAECAEYVRLIRRAEVIMGDGEKRQQPCEAEMAQYRVRS